MTSLVLTPKVERSNFVDGVFDNVDSEMLLPIWLNVLLKILHNYSGGQTVCQVDGPVDVAARLVPFLRDQKLEVSCEHQNRTITIAISEDKPPPSFHEFFSLLMDQGWKIDEMNTLMSPLTGIFVESFLLSSKGRNGGKETGADLQSFEVRDGTDSIQVEMELPGANLSNINISVGEDKELLTISGERRIPGSSSMTSFSKSFNLGVPVEEDQVITKLNNGILLVTAPKMQTVKEPKKLQIPNNV
ncbi:response to heat [Seminavis robusta]|uniref:Response to heat n=1 Tax=Seminavis robusta TaxID=568900 RepID=A0A9N8E8Z5_9STRA|nr:response to heat [Seminavis robusta]|eukprot:Sro625_g177570.1 response to heat (245) ;mRNA; r:28711-29529